MPFSTSTRSTAADCRSQRGWSFGTTQNRIGITIPLTTGIAIPIPVSQRRPLALPLLLRPRIGHVNLLLDAASTRTDTSRVGTHRSRGAHSCATPGEPRRPTPGFPCTPSSVKLTSPSVFPGEDRNPLKCPATPEGRQDAHGPCWTRGAQRRRASWSAATASMIRTPCTICW